MVWHKNYVRATAEERDRMDAIREFGCILSTDRLKRRRGQVPQWHETIHHLLIGGIRMGHHFTICLDQWYHLRKVPFGCLNIVEARRLYGATIPDGSKAFIVSHDVTEWDLYLATQKQLGEPPRFIDSNLVPRQT